MGPKIAASLLAVALVYGATVLLLWLFQRNLLYVPTRERPDLAQAGLTGFHEVTLQTEDGLDLLAWRLPAPEGRATVIYFHGNAGHIGHLGDRARNYQADGFGLLLPEYRGYGGNPGKPDEAGLYADGRAALAYLRKLGIPANKIALHGESLGSGIAVKIAAEAAEQGQPVSAIVLEAPYTSIPEAAQRHYWYLPAKWLVWDRFDSLTRAGKIGAPLLLLHGEKDRTVPVEHGRRLFAAAREPKEAHFFPEAGHLDLPQSGGREIERDFLMRQERKNG